MVICFPGALLMNSCNTETHNKTVSVPSADMGRSSAKPGRYFSKTNPPLSGLYSVYEAARTQASRGERLEVSVLLSQPGKTNWQFTVEADQLVVLLSVMTPESRKSEHCNEFHVSRLAVVQIFGFLKTLLWTFLIVSQVELS